MKNFGKFFVLCFFFSIIATILIACGPNIRASDFTNFNGTVINNPQDDTVQDDTVTNPNENAEKPTDIIETPKDKNDEPKQTQTEECEHEFSAWEITTKPTCTQPGVKSRHCLHCEKVETEEIAPAHQYTLYTQEPTCTQDGYEVQKCEKCGHIDESTKVILPATEHHEFDEHTHQCKHCQEFEPPINNLAGSYWYYNEKITIYFETCTPIKDGYHGNYCTFYGSLSYDGYFIKSTTPNKIKNSYAGDYDLTFITDPDTGITQYFIYLYCNNSETYYLEYKVTIDENTEKPSYTLFCTNKYLFYKDYKNCTLIFAGYEL